MWTILTGGEPLLRRDILEIVRRAAERGLWVVVGTNGVSIRRTWRGAWRRPERGDSRFPRCSRSRPARPLPEGAWRLAEHGGGSGDPEQDRAPFIVQTTAGSHNLGELDAIADFAHDRLAAKVWNLYFLVPTGRGQFVSDITPAQYDEVLASLYRIQRKPNRRMLVNAKCAPHYIKTVLENAPTHPPRKVRASGTPANRRAVYPPSPSWPGLSSIRTYSGGAGGCPAGTHYMGIRPNGDVTPCPYLPVFAGTLRSSSLADLWTSSELFTGIRRRTSLGGRCGECEMNGHCGGCRARAYGMTGELMAEIRSAPTPPESSWGPPFSCPPRPWRRWGHARQGDRLGVPGARAIEYGTESAATSRGTMQPPRG